MTLAEVLSVLRSEGLPVTTGKVRHAMVVGRVQDVPFDGAGNRQFADDHLVQIRDYVTHPPKPGRSRKIRGA